jgi:hypothetical protein
MESENAKAGGDPQDRASHESQMGRSELAIDNQLLLPNVHVDPGASGGFGNSAGRSLNATTC